MSKDSGVVLGCFQTNLSFAEGSGKKNNNWVFGLKAACLSYMGGLDSAKTLPFKLAVDLGQT